MDDNVGSFLTGGKIGKWFARRVIGNYTMPSFDYHIANSVYTAEEFFESLDREKNERRNKAFLNWCWRFFKSRGFITLSEFAFVREASIR